MPDITIHNSLDKPFGKLANDAILPFKIKSRTYPSVVNHVYSNLLPNSTFKEELVQIAPKHVLSVFSEMKNHLSKSTIQSAARLAVLEKTKQNKKFLDALMGTENHKILYYSSNSFLGIGIDKNGENIYGKTLEQVRNEIQFEQNKAYQKENIYLYYIAELNLKKAFRKHNLEKYISKDKKRSIKRLVDNLTRDFGKTEVYSNVPDLNTVLALHEKRNIINYTDPNSLIRIIRKNEVRNVLKKNLFDLKVKALNIFTDYAIEKNVTLSEDKITMKNQLFNILLSQREDFANRILNLYSAKALPDQILYNIKKFKSQWYFPSEKDIDFFEQENIKLPNLEIEIESTLNNNTDVTVYMEDILSPTDSSLKLIVNNLEFKSISHFIAFELNKLYGYVDPLKLYIRIKNVKGADLDNFNKMFQTDNFTITKNKLLEEAITIKLQMYHIKHLIFSIENIEFGDTFELDQTEEIYKKYMNKVVLKIHKIPSFEQFIEKDLFMVDVIKDKIDFYFMILDNLMVHAKSKNKLQVTYDELVEISPFYNYIMLKDPSVPKAKLPQYLFEKNKQYGLTERSLLQIWSIIFNSLKQSEKIVGKNNFDIRYKNLFIWSKYFLSKFNKNVVTLNVMENKKEDAILLTLLSILSTLKEINLKFESPSINNHDLETAIHLCLNKIRDYKHYVEQNLEFEEEIENDKEYEEEEFEGFNLNTRNKFEAFLNTFFNPLVNELTLEKLEEAVFKILNSKVIISIKHQNINFFLSNFNVP
jgi:predicted NAD-dependent protein-ADP-ribosyltransferase YbiA (DUF1768 family)